MNFAFRTIFFVSLFLITFALTATAQSKFEQCLPDEIKKTDRVVGEAEMTVAQKLKKLAARCRNGKLVDRRRREIKLLKQECWGNPPADYLEIIQKRNAEIVVLKKKYTVIEVSCKTDVSTL